MGSQQRWERLVDYLGELGEARSSAAGRIDVTLRGEDRDDRTIQIVMDPIDFDTWTASINGSFWLTAHDIRAQLLEAPADCRFLVFDSYELVPSMTETLPPDPDA